MQNNNLTRFDEGGTHESSPIGGIPQGMSSNGSQNMVEQGESKKGNFIYSNRIALDKGLVKQFNLPMYVANKSVADASKAIDDKFKDRHDKYAQETKTTLLDRLSQAQEHLKAQEQAKQDQMNQAMQANSQQVPDMMNGEVPEGMEEFTQQQSVNPSQMVPEGLNPASPIAAFGGYQNKMYNGGELPDTDEEGITAEGVIQAAGTAYDLGNLAFGKPAQDTSGEFQSAKVNPTGMIASGALKGATAGAALGPLGAGIGAGVGLLAGAFGSNKAKAAALENNKNFAIKTNSNFTNDFNQGGYITRKPSIYANGSEMDVQGKPDAPWYMKQMVPSTTPKSFINNFGEDASILQKYNPSYTNYIQGDANLDGIVNSSDEFAKQPKNKNFITKVGKAIGENYGEAMRYVPVAMNAFQLANLKKPTGVNYNTLSTRFKPEYVDETQLQKIVDQEGNNQMAALTQSGASPGAMRNAILGVGLNKAKALSEAYASAAAQNRATNVQGQTFNRDVDLQNLAIQNRAIDENRMDDAAYRGAKSKLLSTIGTDIGNIGKEQSDAQLAAALTGYSRKGKYLIKPDGSKVTPQEIANITNLYKQQTAVTKAFGGYLNTKKR